MATAKDCYEVSKRLLDHLTTYDSNQRDREAFIYHVNSLLDERQTVLDQLSTPPSAEDQQLGPELLEMDEKIMDKLAVVMGHVKSDRMTVKKKKQKNRSYAQPFSGVSKDGMFLDKRK